MTFEEFLAAINRAKEYFFKRIRIRPNYDKETKEIADENSLNKSTDILNPSEIFFKSIHIYSHLDTDGLCAAAILASALTERKIGFQITILRQLETTYIEEIEEEIRNYNRFIIFSDFGSGQIDILQKHLPNHSYLVLDHHTPQGSINNQEVYHVNPYFYGIKGSNEISGAGVCYYFAKSIDPENIKLSWIAVVGAVGDIQTKGEKNTLQGINIKILEDAIKTGLVETEDDIALPRSKPITQALAFSSPIRLPSISDNENAAKQFLETHHIRTTTELNEPRTLLDLSEMEKKSLNSALIQLLVIKHGMDVSTVKKMVQTFYIIKVFDKKWKINDANDLSSLLNACGRSGLSALGIALLMGDEHALEKAIHESSKYKFQISKALQFARHNLREYPNISVLYGKDIDEKIIGTIVSMLSYSYPRPKKPIVGYADSDNHMLKVSARAPQELVKKGLDLGKIMRNIGKEMDLRNRGGGHPPAAGARIPSMRLREFLEKVDKAVGKMLKEK